MVTFLGLLTTPGSTFYGMSKSASKAFADGLRQEMYEFNVKVVNICPGTYQ